MSAPDDAVVGIEADEALTIEVDRSDFEATVVAIVGELDTHTAPQLGEVLESVAEERPLPLVIDGAGLRFIDSSGIHVLTAAYQRNAVHHPDHPLRLRNLRPGPHRALTMCGLDDLIETDPDGDAG